MKYKSENQKLDPKLLLENINNSIAGNIPMDPNSPQVSNLVCNIELHGQITPVLVYKGKLCDGRHRCLACTKIGIDVTVNIIDDSVSEATVEDYITSVELVNKDLSTWQKTLLVYERYILGRGYSMNKASQVANVRKGNLMALKQVINDEYAIRHNYLDSIKSNTAVKLPNGSYTKSVASMKNELATHQRNLDSNTSSIEAVSYREFDYTRAFAKYDTEDKVSELFWKYKQVSLTKNTELICDLLCLAYPILEMDVTPDKIHSTIYFNNKGETNENKETDVTSD